MSIPIPIVLTQAGYQPQSPATLRTNLINEALTLAPGLTTDLPGTLIEDIASTDVGALTVMDLAYGDLINSVTPYGANLFLLNQLGAIYGVPQGVTANGSVEVVFSGTVGFTIPVGFQVSDGTNTYTAQDATIIGSGGTTPSTFCVAVQAGIFAIPANTVTSITTSVPSGITLTCTNPLAGTPSAGPQTTGAYRAAVIQAGIATAQGVPNFIKTALGNVSGVQPQLISVQQQSPSGWIVVVGGGDPYEVANAIYTSVPDISMLQGCSLVVSAITNANPGVVTTAIAHGLTSGPNVFINGATGMTGINGVNLTITVIDAYHFSIGINTTSSGAYGGGGVVTPNVRNQAISILDYPDTYTINFVSPLQETVTVACSYNTTGTNFVSPAAVSAVVVPAVVAYINAIPTGQPINLLELDATFITAVASILTPQQVSVLTWAVTINGISVSPEAGTNIIPGDAFSYFFTNTSDVTVTQV